MEEHIKKIIQFNPIEYPNDRIRQCVKWLLSLNEADYKSIYIHMPLDDYAESYDEKVHIKDDSYVENEDDSYVENEDDSYVKNEDDSYVKNEDNSRGENEDNSRGENEDNSYVKNENDSHVENEDDLYVKNENDSHVDYRYVENENDSHVRYIDYRYDLYECAHAYVSNVELLRKCLAISPVPLYNSIKTLIRSEYSSHETYVNFDIESCKLLVEHGFKKSYLLHIAYRVSNYDSIIYLIESMTIIELINMLNSIVYYDVVGFLLIDKIYNLNDPCLNRLCKNSMVEYRGTSKIRIILNCYYIIKFMTIDEGKASMIEQNKLYEMQKREANRQNMAEAYQSLHNNLLEFHFRPRGGHTKGAITF
jgi:hypothetical protein